MSDPNETADLAGQLIRGYREHLAEEAGPEIIAVPGRVLSGDIEGQADALADDAARLSELLAASAREPGQRSMEPIAVFRGLSRAAESMAAAATELRRQEWAVLEAGPITCGLCGTDFEAAEADSS
jgi:hypothetical protein